MTTIQQQLQAQGARFIPLLHNGKKPAQAFTDKEFAPADINRHIKAGGNVGWLVNDIAKKPMYVFIDIDTSHGADGLKNFMQWLSDNHLDADQITKETLIQQTATGGLHIIFLSDPNYPIYQNIKFIDGVDIKASVNNFILIAPSTIDGHAYKFLNNKLPQPIPVVLAKAIAKQVSKNKRERQRQVINTPEGKTTERDGLGYYTPINGQFSAIDPFYTIMNGWGEAGARNNVIFKWAQRMRRLTTCETAVAFAKIANDNADDPLDETEMIRTIESAYSFVKAPDPIERDGFEFMPVGRYNGRDVAVPMDVYRRVQSLEYSSYAVDDLWYSDVHTIGGLLIGGDKTNTIDQYIADHRKD